MKRKHLSIVIWPAMILGSLPVILLAQGKPVDYERAANLREKLQLLVYNFVDQSDWIEKTSRFWYRKSVKSGYEFNVVDAATATKKIAFDHEKLAAALATVLEDEVDANDLPFKSIEFTDDEKSVDFNVGESKYSCDLTTYTCKKTGPVERRRRRSRSGFTMWERGPALQAASEEAKASPDDKWEAFIRNYNICIRSKENKEEFVLSHDGSEGNYYTYTSITWSPDSKKLAAYRLRRGYHRVIQYVESSPNDQLQPKYHNMEYAKPGDALDIEKPVLFHVETKKMIDIDDDLFSNPYDMSVLVWWKDSRAFTFEYNQRGHQVYRIIEVDAATGKARAIITEKAETFFCYSRKKYRHDIQDGKEIIWMSERDGWNHLYLYDGATGTVKNQITKGEWVVRSVDKVDEEKRQIYFRASDMYADKDPYFIHGYRINFDGSGLVTLTEGDGNHSLEGSPDMAYYLDT